MEFSDHQQSHLSQYPVLVINK